MTFFHYFSSTFYRFAGISRGAKVDFAKILKKLIYELYDVTKEQVAPNFC